MSSAAEKKNRPNVKEIFSNLIEPPVEAAVSKEGKYSQNSKETASCNPQSKDLFLERVKTFTANNWAAKPLELSPLHCAQYGWSNTHLDQLQCVTCRATLYAGIPEDWDSSAYAEICSKLQTDLQIGHRQLCPWPNNPCPRSFLSLPCYTAEQWKAEVISAFEGLVLLKSNLPELCEDEVASMKVLDNTCIESLMSTIFRYSGQSDDEALQAKVSCILATSGWSASQPIVEDPSITCSICGKEAGLWNYKSLSNRSHKRAKESFDGLGAISQQSLADDNLSSNVSVKSEKSETSNHSGSMALELSKLATSSDSLAQADLLKPASSQESLVNLRVSEGKQMTVDNLCYQDALVSDAHCHDKSVFTEPKIPLATPPELMKELLLSTAPGSSRTHSIYSDSIFSEVGSECFEKRLEDTTDKELELDKAISENPPANHPNHVQQQWMKELLFMTAESKSPEVTESVMSDIGSISFDRRLDTCSVMNSPRSTTPVHPSNSLDLEENEPMRVKRMRFQEPDITLFSVLGEHRPWCPWIAISSLEDKEFDNGKSTNSPTKTKGLPGWRIVLGILLPGLRINAGSVMSSSNSEAWRSVRSVLHDCVSTSSD